MTQALSGFDYANGQLMTDELLRLYELHMRVMWFGANLNRSQALSAPNSSILYDVVTSFHTSYPLLHRANLNRSQAVGSHLLAFVLSSLAQVVEQRPIAGAAKYPYIPSYPKFTK